MFDSGSTMDVDEIVLCNRASIVLRQEIFQHELFAGNHCNRSYLVYYGFMLFFKSIYSAFQTRSTFLILIARLILFVILSLSLGLSGF